MKPILINPDWRGSWRWFSMQAQAVAICLLAAWAVLPPSWQQGVGTGRFVLVVCGVLVAGMVGRLVLQVQPKEGYRDEF